MVIFLNKNKKNNEEEPMTFKDYWDLIKEVFRNHKRWLIAVFIIGAILMFILFGFLFYLSSVLEDKFSIDGIKKGLLLAIPLLALSIASYRSEEHTSELQSRGHIVCRLLLETKTI